VGAAEYTPDGRKPLIKMYEIAKEAAVQHRYNIDAMAISFADKAVSNLNVALTEAPKKLTADTLLTIGIFATIAPNIKPAIKNVNIIYEKNTDRFVRSEPLGNYRPAKIIAFGLPTNYVQEIIITEEFQSIGRITHPTTSQMYASMIDVMVTKIIERKISVQIGGSPTILIIERGKRPRWYRKAKDCPDIN